MPPSIFDPQSFLVHLFTKALNREKSSKTISEYIDTTEMSPAEESMLKKLLLCDPSDVSIDDSQLTRDGYIEFLKLRWKSLRDELARNLDI